MGGGGEGEWVGGVEVREGGEGGFESVVGGEGGDGEGVELLRGWMG